MTLHELIYNIACSLGNTWRFHDDQGNQPPTIRRGSIWLMFELWGERTLVVSLLDPDRCIAEIEVHASAGIGDTTRQIKSELLIPYFRRQATERQLARMSVWVEDWKRLFWDFAKQAGMRVHFTIQEADDEVVGLHAEFLSGLNMPWVQFTVSSFGFLAEVRYLTSDAAIRQQLAVWEQPQANHSVPRWRRILGLSQESASTPRSLPARQVITLPPHPNQERKILG